MDQRQPTDRIILDPWQVFESDHRLDQVWFQQDWTWTPAVYYDPEKRLKRQSAASYDLRKAIVIRFAIQNQSDRWFDLYGLRACIVIPQRSERFWDRLKGKEWERKTVTFSYPRTDWGSVKSNLYVLHRLNDEVLSSSDLEAMVLSLSDAENDTIIPLTTPLRFAAGERRVYHLTILLSDYVAWVLEMEKLLIDRVGVCLDTLEKGSIWASAEYPHQYRPSEVEASFVNDLVARTILQKVGLDESRERSERLLLLHQSLDHPHYGVRDAVIRELGKLGDTTAVEPLIEKLSAGSAQAAVVNALVRIGDKRAIPALAEAMERLDRDSALRSVYGRALDWLRDSRGIPDMGY